MILAAVLLNAELQAQQTGNIVEIFGRERTETTSEGTIVHDFTEGLALRNAMRPGMLTGMQDILFWQMATDRFGRPQAGKTLEDTYSINPETFVWEAIEVDTTGFFRGNLNRAYVYTEFESPEETIALLDATGHTRVFINGMPQEGDHYDYAHTLIPFHLKQGLNQFVYTYGRFGRVSSKIVIPEKALQFSPRDMTLPSLIRGERDDKWGAVRVVNASEEYHEGLTIRCVLESGESISYRTEALMPMAVRKMKFRIPYPSRDPRAGSISATVFLEDDRGQEVDRIQIRLNVMDAGKHHERTFVSNIDGSVQYYSVVPSTSNAPNQAFVLSVHGASVEATNQARAYQQKDWGHIIAPTNRRPFGFNWEEWGRLDALEVLHEARKLFPTDTAQTYLTGHSMGGHGSWFLGATYPDKFAAIAPAAGYPDIIGYRRTGTDSLIQANPHFEMIYRGALPGRTLDLVSNYKQSGVYVLHGDADEVVPVTQARLMRGKLGEIHPNFSYYEYPGGTHWYGDHSMDWPPLFDFLRQNTIPPVSQVKDIEFTTASPGVSATNYWISINQQLSSYQHSTIQAKYTNDTIFAETNNIAHLTIMVSLLQPESLTHIHIDGQTFPVQSLRDIHLRRHNQRWNTTGMVHLMEKHPERYGGFKLAFTNNMLFVYATGGSEEENQWYENKARYDAETFLYRGNGSVDVIPDTLFSPQRYRERNVIVYGNADNNHAWSSLLQNSPVQVTSEGISFGNTWMESKSLGTYFIQPRIDSQTASVGVVAGTGPEGMKATFPNDYFSGITGFPDLLIFEVDWIKDGVDGIRVSGFFGNDWSVKNGEFR
ncbi:MAG: alpha/beta hydrolase [Bacteroidetes bacterium]|nr:MAG: alpha/beta hydrolase [Bacteroidota bacterium]